MDENADASQAVFEPPPENWRRPPGQPRTTWMKNVHDDLSSLDLGIHEARDLAQNRPLCRLMSLHSAMHALVVVHATTGLDVVLVADTADTTVPQISVSAHAPVTATPVASRGHRVTSFNGVISTVALVSYVLHADSGRYRYADALTIDTTRFFTGRMPF